MILIKYCSTCVSIYFYIFLCVYIGEFKSQYNNHTKSFRHPEFINVTELSKHMWNLKDHSLDNNLSWEIHKKASPYQCGSKCLSEKVSIICADQDTLLNKRTELISKCHNRNKFLLAEVKK